MSHSRKIIFAIRFPGHLKLRSAMDRGSNRVPVGPASPRGAGIEVRRTDCGRILRLTRSQVPEGHLGAARSFKAGNRNRRNHARCDLQTSVRYVDQAIHTRCHSKDRCPLRGPGKLKGSHRRVAAARVWTFSGAMPPAVSKSSPSFRGPRRTSERQSLSAQQAA